MRKNKKGFEIEETVFKTFLKHVKAKKLYPIFRWSVNFTNGHPSSTDIFHRLSATLIRDYRNKIDRVKRCGSSFINAHSVDDILLLMKDSHDKNIVVEDTSKFQMAIMNMVNILLHSCIEYSIPRGNMMFLEELGSSIFEESCRALLGDSFKDITEEAIDPRQREFLAKIQDMVMAHGGIPYGNEMLNENLLRGLRDEIRAYHRPMRQMDGYDDSRHIDFLDYIDDEYGYSDLHF